MRILRSLLTFAVLPALLVAVRGAFGAEPTCNRWDLEVSCQTNPSRVIVTDPFTATVTVRNTGDVALAGVTIQIRGDLGAKPADGSAGPVQTVVDKLEPGESKQLSGTFACDTVGVTRVIAGARDSQGWAAANSACTVDVIGLPAVHSGMRKKDLQGADKGIFRLGESFLYVLEVENDGGTTVTPDLKAVFTLPKEIEFVSGAGDNGITVTGKDQSAETSAFVLAPNQKAKITLTVKAVAVPPTNLVQAKASIQTTAGAEVAAQSESTTIKN